MNRRTGPNRRGSTGGGRGAPAPALFTLGLDLYGLVRFASWADSGFPSRRWTTDAPTEETAPADPDASEASEPSPRPERVEAHDETTQRAGTTPRGRRLASSLAFATAP